MGQIVGDTDGSLLIDGAELPGDYAMGQSIVFPMVPPGATVTAHFRTRLTALDKKNATPTDQQARDITCATWGGNVGGRKPGIPILCVNQRTDCAQVPVGSVALVQMSAPPMGPNPTHYVLFATLGHPKANTNCGAPGAADFALWGGGIHPWGVGAFPVSSLLGNWTGGDALPGFALASSIPGIGLITTPPATGPLPCGGGPPILGIPFIALPKFAFTLQALVVDFGSRQGTIQPISVTNAVQVAMGNCSCQLN
jgi:hypothetical protein